MKNTTYHEAGFTVPSSATPPSTPRGRISLMLQQCGMEIIYGDYLPAISPNTKDKDGNQVFRYHAFIAGKFATAQAQFKAAFPQLADALTGSDHPDGICKIALNYPAFDDGK
jgi:hypothetical protein